MDDITAKVQKGSVSPMQSIIDFTTSWSSENKMILNENKTKDIVISFHKHPIDIPPVSISGKEIERVSSTKLLGVIITEKLTWTENTTYMCTKASKRLHYLRQLRRAGLDDMELLAFYTAVIRPVIEYACPFWHTSLVRTDALRLENIQKRAMRIIEQNLSYDAACNKHQLEETSTRREILAKKSKVLYCNEVCITQITPSTSTANKHTVLTS